MSKLKASELLSMVSFVAVANVGYIKRGRLKGFWVNGEGNDESLMRVKRGGTEYKETEECKRLNYIKEMKGRR